MSRLSGRRHTMALRQVAARRRRIERRKKQARRDATTEMSRRQTRAVQSMTPTKRHLTPTSNRAVDDLALLPDAWGEDPDPGRIARDEAEPPLERKG